MNKRVIIAILLMFLGASSLSYCQVESKSKPTRNMQAKNKPQKKQPGKQQNNQETRELVRTLMMVRMSKELGLDDEMTVVMIRRFDRLKEQETKFRQERRKLLKTLEASFESNNEEEITNGFNKLVAFDKKSVNQKRKLFDEVCEGLTPTQKAKLYVFKEKFEKDMRKMIQQARERRGGRQAGQNQRRLNGAGKRNRNVGQLGQKGQRRMRQGKKDRTKPNRQQKPKQSNQPK